MRRHVLHLWLRSLVAGSALAVALLGGAGPASALGDVQAGSIDGAIGRSTLSPAEKDSLASGARQAIRSGIPAADVEAVVSRGIERGVGAAGIAELLDIAVTAQNAGVPAQPLLNRIEQGLAKQVPQERIAAAVKRLAGHLAAARPVVDGLVGKGVSAGSATERETAMETVARAFERSLSADAVSDISGRIVQQKGTLSLFERAVGAITGMVELGVPAEPAARLVQQGLDRGYSEKDFDRMERQVAESIRGGKSADDALKALRDDRGRDRSDDRRGGARESGPERRGDAGRGGRGR